VITLLRRKPTWQHNKNNIIMTWHPYHLLELYNISHGGIYIHTHTYIYENITKHVWRHIPKTYTKILLQNYFASTRKKRRIDSLHLILHFPCSLIEPKVLHLTLTCLISWFHNMRTFFCNIHWGSSWNSPSSSACNTYQLITWSPYLAYFLSIDTWKT